MSDNQSNQDQAEKCARCDSMPEDILMLACNHDLCLQCAAVVFNKQQQKRSNTDSLYCEICNTPTQLDHSSIYELEKMMIQTKQQSAKFYQAPKEDNIETPTTNGHYSPYITPQTQSHFTPAFKQQKQTTLFCQEHPDEEISYFCLDCLSNCICPECVIHGAHKNHEVLTIKKAYPRIKVQVEEKLSQITGKVENLKLYQEKFSQKRREGTEDNKGQKKVISNCFTELRAVIDRKEKEMMMLSDKLLDENMHEIDTNMQLLNAKIQTLQKDTKTIEHHLNQNQQHLLLNYYAQYLADMEASASVDDQTLRELNGNLNAYSVKKNSEIIQEFLKQVAQFQHQIGGIHPNQQQKLKEFDKITLNEKKYQEQSEQFR